MSVYKSKNSPYWQYDFRLQGLRFHGSTGQTSKRSAERVEAQRRADAALGPSKPRITLDEGFGRYWEQVAKTQASAATTEYQLANLIAGLGGSVAFCDVAQGDLHDYTLRRRAKVSDSSVNREVQLYRRVWKFLNRQRRFDLGDEPDWQALLFREPKERVRSLSDAEEARLFEALRADLQPFAAFAIMTGARMRAVIRLRWSDVDFDAREARLQMKGGGTHAIPLTPGAVALIANQPRVGPYVFTYVCQKSRAKRRAGQRYPLSLTGWRRAWGAALAAAGVSDFRFHDLRHTAATRLLRHTGNLKQVQQLLGHTDIATTARYAHVSKDDLRAAMMDMESRNSPGATDGGDAKSLSEKRNQR